MLVVQRFFKGRSDVLTAAAIARLTAMLSPHSDESH
jgi:hypothetical protein